MVWIILGAVMLILLFGALTAVVADSLSWRDALIIWLQTLAILGAVTVAVLIISLGVEQIS